MRNEKHLQMMLVSSLVFLVSWFLPAHVSAQKTVNQKLTPREIAQKTLPSTVLLVMENSETEEAKSGSGFFVAEDIVVTNFHVIKKTTEGYAKVYGQDKIYEVLGVVGTDEKNDLALLKIKGIKGKPLKLNTDDSTAIGDEVFAVGNPKGLEGTFSQGIVSSIRKTIKLNLLQITASISAGSSGGAVLNDNGEVIGVAVGAIESGQSLNFAIPVSLLRSLFSNQKPLKPLANNTIVAENKTQPNQKIEPKKPNNLPTTKPLPQGKSKIQYRIPDLAKENLLENVKLVKESEYEVKSKFEKWELSDLIKVTTTQYNNDGYKELYQSIYYKSSLYADKLPYFYKEKFSYNYSNNTVVIEEFSKCGSCPQTKFLGKRLIKYENNGTTFLGIDGKIEWKSVKSEDKNGKTIDVGYDKDGKLISENTTYVNKNSEKIVEFKTTEAGESGKLQLLDKTITTEKPDYIQESYTLYTNEEPNINRISSFDKKTKLKSLEVATFYDSQQTTIERYEYEFDTQGNWIKRTQLMWVEKFGKTFFEPFKVTTREISYY